MSDSLAHSLPTTGTGRPARASVQVFDWLLVVAVVAVAAVIARAIWFTPPEALQGEAQKIFYIHVPSAVMGLYLACPLVAIGGGLYLWMRDERLDRLAESSAEIALVFLSIVLVTGPLWGKPIWGTWWTWDARLTSTLFLWFVLLGYTVLRGAIEDRQQRARYSAVLGIMAAMLVPFIHLSVRLFRTMHPQPIVLTPDKPKLSPEMGLTLSLAFVAFALLFVALLRGRLKYAALRDRVEAQEAGGE
ncbi:MAG: cytochrome c biogenesis protein CcsA [Gemmatimonadaceae bacterium]|nr:cytochrome c biogenesis protein CcsA [Gemmatimonadaceae bacterium]